MPDAHDPRITASALQTVADEALIDALREGLAALADRQFFIRKAIAWALWEYAKTELRM